MSLPPPAFLPDRPDRRPDVFETPSPAGATGTYSAADYWEQRLRTTPGIAGVGFINFGHAFNEWMYRVRRRVFLREVRRLKVDFSRAKVLDIGSGTGFWIRVWESLGVKSLTASDITRVSAESLRAAHPGCQVIQLDISSPGARAVLSAEFDVISAMDVLFHITGDHEWTVALENISRSLRSQGFLIFSENLPHRELPRSPTQVNRTLREITGNLESRGLRILRRVPMFVLMNVPLDINSGAAARLWKLFMAPVHFFPALGSVYGPLLYPLECALTRTFREGPSTELVICQKI